jgi:hypothetical protein
MVHVRFANLHSRPMEFLDFTSVTLDEFQQLVPPFEAAFQAHMAAWRLDGPAGTFKQEPTVLNKPLCRKYLVDANIIALPSLKDRVVSDHILLYAGALIPYHHEESHAWVSYATSNIG